MENFSLKTKASYRRNTKQTKYLKIITGIVAALILLYLFGNMLGIMASYITTPLYALRDWSVESGSTIPSYFRSRNELLRQIDDLERKLSAYSSRNAAFVRIMHENDELRTFLGIEEDRRIAAGILARPPFLPYDALLIDRGEKDGIKEGAAVFSGNDQAIGLISSVFPESALVTLFSSPGMEVTAYILGPQIYAAAFGEGGGVIRVSVPQGIQFAIGDVALLPTLEAGILGTVSKIESTPTQPEQYGYILMETPIQSLHLLSVSSRAIKGISFEEAEEHMHAQTYEELLIDVPPEFSADGMPATSSPEMNANAAQAVEER